MQDKLNMPQKPSRSNLEAYIQHRPRSNPKEKLKKYGGIFPRHEELTKLK